VLQPRQCSPIRDECSWSVPTHLEVASLVSQITIRCRARAFVCHLVLSCVTAVVHARRVCHSLCPAIQLPQCRMLLHCLICRFCSLVQTKNSEVAWRHPVRLGWGLSKHSALWSGCESLSSTKPARFTRGIKIPIWWQPWVI